MKWSSTIIFSLLTLVSVGQQANRNSLWPEMKAQTRPWTRWWWMGNAMDEKNIAELLELYSNAGFGGVEVTPIYGAMGFEDKYISYLSPDWMKMLGYSIQEAHKNNMGVDLNLGTGWPFGGPQIDFESASSKLIFQIYTVIPGKPFAEKITIDNQEQIDAGAVLQCLTAYGPVNEIVDVTGFVATDGTLNWKPTNGEWKLVAAFCGRTLQKVKRAAPGGEGYVLDHFSQNALDVYLSRYNKAFGVKKYDIRSTFNDSFEVYGSNWTPSFFEFFQSKRGYSLKPFLRELSEKLPGDEKARRVHYDYRLTISELLLENFTQPWTAWAHRQYTLTRNQAHGSPGNLLDLYGTVDIPECETFGSSYFPIPGLRRDSADIRNVDPDPVMLKFASSAAHITGKNLVSCETFTWLGEHFKTSLSQCKPEVEQVFLSGVNHIFYHGTTYSPKEAGWPGWLFYASVNFVPANSLWPHLKGLNDYISRCQSVLQEGKPDNDLLVYWPVSDYWMNPKSADLLFTIHAIDQWLHPTKFYENVKDLMKAGFSLDFISDSQLHTLRADKSSIYTTSNNTYRTIIFPGAEFLPETTLNQAVELARSGALVIFEKLPENVPGLSNYDIRIKQLTTTLKNLRFAERGKNILSARVGKGEIIVTGDIEKFLKTKNINPETLSQTGLQYIRRKTDTGTWYYLVNHTPKEISEEIVPLKSAKSYAIFDPQNAGFGMAKVRNKNKKHFVKVQLQPGESIFLLASNQALDFEHWKYFENSQRPLTVSGPWNLRFIAGGPELPKPVKLDKPGVWTTPEINGGNIFSGTAVYSASFELPERNAIEYLLDIGKVYESARVSINGHDAGIYWGIPFTGRVRKYLQPGLNTIEIEVTNLMANRIRWMDEQKIEWRKYHEINFVNINYKPFDASSWSIMPSGLVGPITLTPFKPND